MEGKDGLGVSRAELQRRTLSAPSTPLPESGVAGNDEPSTQSEGIAGSDSSPSLLSAKKSATTPSKSKSSVQISTSQSDNLPDGELSCKLSRSRTMPTQQSLPGFTRKPTSVTINLDRLKNAKQLAEKAIKNRKVFLVQGPYPAIREELRKRGWVEKFYRMEPRRPRKSPRGAKVKRAAVTSDSDDDNTDDDDDDDDDPDADDPNDHGGKVAPWEEDNGIYGIMSRIVRNSTPTFIWSVKRDVVDLRALRKDQMINHYGKAGSFTTKVGLCINMRNLPWFEPADPDSFFPRCYRLSHDEEKKSFIDDFRLTACIGLLKCVVRQSHSADLRAVKDAAEERPEEKTVCTNPSCTKSRPNTTVSNRCVHAPTPPSPRKGLSTMTKQAKVAQSVPQRAVDLALSQCQRFLRFLQHDDIDETSDQSIVSSIEWDLFIQWYYQVIHDSATINESQTRTPEIEALLAKVKDKLPQYELDGTRNVWIVKPGAKSRGRGITCYDRLEDMLKLVSSSVVKKEGKYIVQKYIERPLLVYNTKFDIRQWFLVTDWNPLTLYVYKDSYLRFCSQEYTLRDLDEAIHLSNNAIQKNYANGPRSTYLPTENMWTCHDFKRYLKGRGVENVWDSVIYPGMKKAVIGAMLCSQDIVEYRKSAFELYGADFMLTEDFRPWLIEINSSPSMAASTRITAKLCSSVLEDCVKVVLDRKIDKNADSGRFELAYKQPHVTVPPYIGINLGVEGAAVRKPAWLQQQQQPPRVRKTQDDVSKASLVAASNVAVIDTPPGGNEAETGGRRLASSPKRGRMSDGGALSSVDKEGGGRKTAGHCKVDSSDKRSSSSPSMHRAGASMPTARSTPSVLPSHKLSVCTFKPSTKKKISAKVRLPLTVVTDTVTDVTSESMQAMSITVGAEPNDEEQDNPTRKSLRSPTRSKYKRDKFQFQHSRSLADFTRPGTFKVECQGLRTELVDHAKSKTTLFDDAIAEEEEMEEDQDESKTAEDKEGVYNLSEVCMTSQGRKMNKLAGMMAGTCTSAAADAQPMLSRSDKQMPDKSLLPMTSVETVDLQSIRPAFYKGGVVPAVDSPWTRTCTHCGSGMNLRLDKSEAPPCGCQSDSIRLADSSVGNRVWVARSVNGPLLTPTPPCHQQQRNPHHHDHPHHSHNHHHHHHRHQHHAHHLRHHHDKHQPRHGQREASSPRGSSHSSGRALSPRSPTTQSPTHHLQLPSRLNVDQSRLAASVYAQAQRQAAAMGNEKGRHSGKLVLRYTDAHIPKPSVTGRINISGLPHIVRRYSGHTTVDPGTLNLEHYRHRTLSVITQNFR